MISLDAMPVALSNNRGFAWVNACDVLAVSKCQWKIRKSGPDRFYASSRHMHCAHRGSTQDLHRIVADLAGIPATPLIDHKDGDGLNCTRANIRSATVSQNIWNRRPKRAGVGLRGVRRQERRFLAQIVLPGRGYKYLGSFSAAESAARVWDMWAKEAFGGYAWLNYPEERR